MNQSMPSFDETNLQAISKQSSQSKIKNQEAASKQTEAITHTLLNTQIYQAVSKIVRLNLVCGHATSSALQFSIKFIISSRLSIFIHIALRYHALLGCRIF
jgi:hypothetical protein